MEMIKSIVKQFYPLLIMMTCVSFALYTFFSANLHNGNGVFEAGGNIYALMLGTDEVENEGLSYIGGKTVGDVPVVSYNSGAQENGTNLTFKELLCVTKPNGTVVSGMVEDDFAIYLTDIKTQGGVSALEFLTMEQIEAIEEIPAAFLYNKETDRLYICKSGVYIVQIKIYGSGGGQAVYEFQLPVETT